MKRARNIIEYFSSRFFHTSSQGPVGASVL